MQSHPTPPPSTIHPTAIIDPRASLAEGVTVGPFAVIGPHVTLAARCVIGPHAVLEGPLWMGEEGVVSAFSCIGGPPQDRKYNGEPTALYIGPRAQIREHVTIHRGTVQGRKETRLGSDVLVMANAHIAHDCVLGDRVTLANASLLAGHVTLQDDVITGGLACFHQHVTVGRGAFIAAGAMVERDVPPYCRAAGDRAALVGLNLIGLQRSGLDPKALARLRAAYLLLFRTDAPLAQTSQEAATRWPDDPFVLHLLDFIKTSARGLCRARVGPSPHPTDDPA